MVLKSDTGPLAHVPLWILESSVHHGAIRLYAYLSAKWCDRDGLANPSRSELATVLKCSTPTVDRWVKQLLGISALAMQHQTVKPQQYVENLYQLKLISPRGSHTDKATPKTSTFLPYSDKPQQDIQLQATNGLVLSGDRVSISTNISTSTYPARFESFWSRYPRNRGKKAASEIWKKLKIEHDTPLYREVMDGLTRYLKAWEDENVEERYICHAVRFLKERRWEDEPQVNHKPKLTQNTLTMIDASKRFLERHRREE
jgi:hypothetical protein